MQRGSSRKLLGFRVFVVTPFPGQYDLPDSLIQVQDSPREITGDTTRLQPPPLPPHFQRSTLRSCSMIVILLFCRRFSCETC